jgi:hypothetical protein
MLYFCKVEITKEKEKKKSHSADSSSKGSRSTVMQIARRPIPAKQSTRRRAQGKNQIIHP